VVLHAAGCYDRHGSVQAFLLLSFASIIDFSQLECSRVKVLSPIAVKLTLAFKKSHHFSILLIRIQRFVVKVFLRL
jgi:hypothetical protein